MRNTVSFISPRKKLRSEHECRGAYPLSRQTVAHAGGSHTRFQNSVLVKGEEKPPVGLALALYPHFPQVVLLCFGH